MGNIVIDLPLEFILFRVEFDNVQACVVEGYFMELFNRNSVDFFEKEPQFAMLHTYSTPFTTFTASKAVLSEWISCLMRINHFVV